MALPQIIIIFAAFAGLLIAAYIYHKKQAQEVLVCPLDGRCDAVVHSEYSTFFEIPVEFLGILYYAVVALTYGLFIAFPFFVTPFATFVILGATIIGLLFSFYLTFIQAFALRQWCTWCLASMALCVIIFSTAMYGSEFQLPELLATNHEFILLIHILGVALGLGGATITDVFFFKFLKDFRISTYESDILRTLSQVIWFALAMIVLSGVGLFLPQSAELLASSRFLMKMVIVFVIILNGALLNLLVSPKLVKISFGARHVHHPDELHRLRKLAFALGAISIVSWYSAFIVAFLHSIDMRFWLWLGYYALLLFVGVTLSQLMEHRFKIKSTE